MTEQNTAPAATPIQDRTPKPPGLMPKNIQAWVMLGLAVLMVLIMWLTGGKKKPPSTPKSSVSTFQPAAQPEINEAQIAALQNRIQEMPGRTYRGANRVPDTIRYFVDKFPMFLDSTVAAKPLVTFSFIDPGLGNLDAFRTHLDGYASFLQRLQRFAFVFASPAPKLFDSAQKLFQKKTNPPTGTLSEQLVRYFTLRANWEAKRYELLKDSDIEFMNHARRCFAGEAFESAFAEWKSGLISEQHLLAALETRIRLKQEIRFSTCLLPRDYSSFAQNSHFLRKLA